MPNVFGVSRAEKLALLQVTVLQVELAMPHPRVMPGGTVFQPPLLLRYEDLEAGDVTERLDDHQSQLL